MIRTTANIKCQIQEFYSDWFLDSNTPFEIAEQMLLYNLKVIGQLKDAHKAREEAAKKEVEQQATQKPVEEPAPTSLPAT